MVRDIGLSGLLHNVPFATNLSDLLGNRAPPVTAAIDHLRVAQVALSPDPEPRAVPVTLPPVIFITGIIPPPSVTAIIVPQLGIRVTLDVHLVRHDDMAAADGSPISPDNTMVVQCRANCTIAPLALDGGILAIDPTTEDIELGIFGVFARLPPTAERMGLARSELLLLFRRHNPWTSPLSDRELSPLLDFPLLINDPAVHNRIRVPPIPLNLSGLTSVLPSLPGSAAPLKVWNAGLTGDATRAIVGLQVEPESAVDMPGVWDRRAQGDSMACGLDSFLQWRLDVQIWHAGLEHVLPIRTCSR